MEEAIKHFYPNLVKVLPMNDPYFISLLHSADLLLGNLKDEIQSKPTRAEKALHFLDHGINYDETNFRNLLEVLEKSEDNNIIKFGKQLRNKIDFCSTTTGQFIRICLLFVYKISIYLCNLSSYYLIPYMAKGHLSANQHYIKQVNEPLKC